MRVWDQFKAVFHMVEEFQALQESTSPLSFRRSGFSVRSGEFNGAMEVFTVWFSSNALSRPTAFRTVSINEGLINLQGRCVPAEVFADTHPVTCHSGGVKTVAKHTLGALLALWWFCYAAHQVGTQGHDVEFVNKFLAWILVCLVLL